MIDRDGRTPNVMTDIDLLSRPAAGLRLSIYTYAISL